MRTWNFKNGIEVVEVAFDYDLHTFEVYDKDGNYLGMIYPDSIETMEAMKDDLNNGLDPISEEWEDGNGSTCTLDGWL